MIKRNEKGQFIKGGGNYTGMLGRHHSEETRHKLSLANKGKKNKLTEIHLRNIRLAGKKRRTYIFKKCEVCLKEFKVYKYREKIARFCSCKCRAKKVMPLIEHRSFKKGMVPWNKGKINEYSINKKESNPNWQGGKSFEPYSPEFNNSLKKKIKKDDSYTCQLCGDNIPEFVSHRRQLVIHHIDYDKKNSKESNLITLCNFCNISVNRDRKEWTKYFQDKKRGINDIS